MIDFWLYAKYYYVHFANYPLMVRLMLSMLVLLSLLYLVSIIQIFLSYHLSVIRKKRWKRIADRHFNKVKGIVLAQEVLDQEEIIRQIGPLVGYHKKDEGKILWTKLFLSIKEEYSQDMNPQNVETLQEVLQLREFWSKKLRKASTLYRKKQAMRKLYELSGNVHTLGLLAPFLFHRNRDLRRFARHQYMRLENDTPFAFLEEGFDKDFNRIDRLKLHTVLKEKEERGELPQLITFVQGNDNMDFRCFLIQEIAFFQQKNAAPYLFQMYKSSRNRVELAVLVESLGKLKYEKVLPTFYKDYEVRSSHVKRAIINAIGSIASKDSLSFLQRRYELSMNEKEKQIIEEAIRQCTPTP